MTTPARLVPQYDPFECRTITFFAGGKQVQVVRKGDNLVMATFDYATEEGKASRHCRLLNAIYNAGYRDCAQTTAPPPGEWKRGWKSKETGIIVDTPPVVAPDSWMRIEYRVVGEGEKPKDDGVVRWMFMGHDGTLCRHTYTTEEACVAGMRDTCRMFGRDPDQHERLGRPVRVRLTVEPVGEVGK